jgi:xylan 1,4-beta-xylosidase
VYPAWTLSDDHGPRLRFTGMFFGVRADDLDGRGWSADVGLARVRFTPQPSS